MISGITSSWQTAWIHGGGGGGSDVGGFVKTRGSGTFIFSCYIGLAPVYSVFPEHIRHDPKNTFTFRYHQNIPALCLDLTKRP